MAPMMSPAPNLQTRVLDAVSDAGRPVSVHDVSSMTGETVARVHPVLSGLAARGKLLRGYMPPCTDWPGGRVVYGPAKL